MSVEWGAMTEIAIPAGLENDPEVYAAMKSLALSAIQNAKEILETTAPSVQMQVVRMLLPAVSRSLSQRNEDDNDELKAELQSLYEDVRKHIGAV